VCPSESVVFLKVTIEATVDQTLGNWYHRIKPTHRIKNLVTVKCLLKVVKGKVVFVLN
jgi:hypothetical protein